jgi:hypothetical protein
LPSSQDSDHRSEPPHADDEPVGQHPPRHWFWKVYAVATATLAAYDATSLVGARVPVDLVACNVIGVLTAVGVVGFAFSRPILWSWIWSLVWWMFPVSILIAKLLQADRLNAALVTFPGARASLPSLSPVHVLVVISSYAVYRYSRSPVWAARQSSERS